MSHSLHSKTNEGAVCVNAQLSLALVAVIMFSLDLFGLDLARHRLHEIAWIVCFDNVLLSCRDHLT